MHHQNQVKLRVISLQNDFFEKSYYKVTYNKDHKKCEINMTPEPESATVFLVAIYYLLFAFLSCKILRMENHIKVYT